MGLKILHSADWHLGASFTGFSEKQRKLLQWEQQQIPYKIASLCRREDCDLLLLAGDIFDGIPSQDMVNLVKDALRRCGIPVLISPGNRDFCTPDSPWLREIWPENVFVFTGELESVTISGLDCRIYGAAYQGTNCPSLLENFTARGTEHYRIALLHGDPTQADSPYCPVTSAQVRQSGLSYLALGHVHKAGAFRSGDTLCAWPGCPMGCSWEETGEKGVCLVTLEEQADIQAIRLDTLSFHDLHIDISDDIQDTLDSLLPIGGSQDFFRVTLNGFGNVDLKALQSQYRAFPNLEFQDNTESPADLWVISDEDSLEGIYFQMLHDLMEADDEHADQIQLAAEISRMLLSGKEVIL